MWLEISVEMMITNAILLNDKDEEFWKSLRRSDIQVWISRYVLNIDYKAIEEKARKHEVRLFYTSTKMTDKNEKSWMKFTLDAEGKQYWLNAFEKCTLKNCVTLKHGKLYTCPTIAHIEHFNKCFNKNLEISEFDYVDIYKVNSYSEILKAMVKPTSFCRYCKTNQLEYSTWSTTKKDISEWT